MIKHIYWYLDTRKDRELGSFSVPFVVCIICLLILLVIYPTYLTKNISYASQDATTQHARKSSSSSQTSSHDTTSPSLNSSFLTYQNNGALGMTIKYPSNWKTILVDDKALVFLPPSKRDNFSENLVVALFDINSNVSANQLADKAINNYGGHYDDFFIISLKPGTFNGEPAYVLSYTYTSPLGGTIIAMDIGIKDQNKAYVISYSAEQPEYHTYIPTVQKMIHSFHVT